MVFVNSLLPHVQADQGNSGAKFMRPKPIFDSAQEGVQSFSLLSQIDQLLSLRPMSQQEIQAYLHKGMQLFGEALGVADVILFQIFEKPLETLLEQKVRWTLSGDPLDAHAHLMSSMERSGIGGWKSLLISGGVHVLSAIELSIDEQSFLARKRFSSAIIIPVFVQEKPWGFVLAGNADIRPSWDDSAIMVAKIIASVIGWFLLLERLQASIGRHNEELFELTHARDTFARENSELKHWKEHIFRTFMSDFITPVNTLIGFSSTFQANELTDHDPEIRQTCIDNIFEQSQQLEKMLKKVTFVSRSEPASPQRDFHPVDLRFVCLELASLFQQRAVKQNIDCTHAIDERPMIVRSEQSLFRQTLFNLLDHCLQETPENGWLSFHADSRDEIVVIRISHSMRGRQGVPSENTIEKISSSSRMELARNYLSIAQRVVDLHHGKLEYDFDVQIGTALTITLPRATS
jgi:signal transduction histidine kinase